MSEQSEQRVDLTQLQGDQEVYGSDDQWVGIVEAVTADRNTGEPYLEVSPGFAKTIYIPQGAIAYAVLGEPVRLYVHAAEALERFTVHPNAM